MVNIENQNQTSQVNTEMKTTIWETIISLLIYFYIKFKILDHNLICLVKIKQIFETVLTFDYIISNYETITTRLDHNCFKNLFCAKMKP